MPVFRDSHGQPVSASEAQTIEGLDSFAEALLGFSADVNEIFAVADSDRDCALAQAFAAMAWISCETADGLAAAKPYVERAQALGEKALPRERAIVSAAARWFEGDQPEAARILERVLDDHPGDLVSAKICQSLHFNLGDAPGLLRAPLKVADACASIAYAHGMLAFGYEECHLLDEAEAAVHRAIELRQKEPWAHHAMSHVCEARGTLEYGAEFMRSMSATWTNLTSFMYTHNWWHLCLFYVDLDRLDDALQMFDTHVWGIDKVCVQDQINAISLLYRLERLGVEPGRRWQDIADHVALRARDQLSAFLDLQFIYALARAGRPETGAMLEGIRRRAAEADQHELVAWRDVAGVAAPAIVALAQGEPVRAWSGLARILPALPEIGGSHAQRDLIYLFHLDALVGAGRLARAQQLLEIRRLARPRVAWIRRALCSVYGRLGLEAVARQYLPADSRLPP